MHLPENGLPDPLPWWQERSKMLPHLALLARRVLCIPASSAESERIFSSAGLIVSKKRQRLKPTVVRDLVFLRSCWATVDEYNSEQDRKKV